MSRSPQEVSDGSRGSEAPILERTKETPGPATDFESLRGALNPPPKAEQRRTTSDYALEFLTPFMVFLMMLALMYFLLDVRFVFTEDLDTQLRRGAFFFVMGIVALNRLVGQFGKDQSRGYQVAMGAAVLLFAYVATQRTGSLARGFLDFPMVRFGFNISAIAFIWWATNRITRECCLDESPSGGEVGLLTAARRTWRAGFRELRDKDWRALVKRDSASDTQPGPLDSLQDALVAVDPSKPREEGQEQKIPPPKPTKRLPKRHPGISVLYVSVPAMILFAVGQRLLQTGGEAMVIAGNVYVGVFTVSALMLLMLSSLRSVRAYFRARKIHIPGGLGVFWMCLGMAVLVLVIGAGLLLPAPGIPLAANLTYREYDPSESGRSSRYDYHERQTSAPSEESDERDPNLSSDDGRHDGAQGHDGAEGQDGGEGQNGGEGERGDQNEGDAGSQEGEQNQPSRGSESQESRSSESSERQNAQSGEAEGEQESRSSESQREQQSRQGSRRSNTRSAPQFNPGQLSNAARYLGIAAVVVLALFLAYGAFQGIKGLARRGARRGKRGRGLLGRLLDALGRVFGGIRLPSLPVLRPRVRVRPDVAASAHYANPIHAAMPVREKVQYSYAALCALALDLGVPRRDDQTPFEYARAFPEALRPLHAVAGDLTELYVSAAYSPANLDESVLPRLETFWSRFERFRGRVVR